MLQIIKNQFTNSEYYAKANYANISIPWYASIKDEEILKYCKQYFKNDWNDGYRHLLVKYVGTPYAGKVAGGFRPQLSFNVEEICNNSKSLKKLLVDNEIIYLFFDNNQRISTDETIKYENVIKLDSTDDVNFYPLFDYDETKISKEVTFTGSLENPTDADKYLIVDEKTIFPAIHFNAYLTMKAINSEDNSDVRTFLTSSDKHYLLDIKFKTVSK